MIFKFIFRLSNENASLTNTSFGLTTDLFNFFVNFLNNVYIKQEENYRTNLNVFHSRTIYIDHIDLSVFEFDINETNKRKLIYSGYFHTMQYLRGKSSSGLARKSIFKPASQHSRTSSRDDYFEMVEIDEDSSEQQAAETGTGIELVAVKNENSDSANIPQSDEAAANNKKFSQVRKRLANLSKRLPGGRSDT